MVNSVWMMGEVNIPKINVVFTWKNFFKSGNSHEIIVDNCLK